MAAERAETMAMTIQSKLRTRGQSTGGQHRAAESKGQREDGVLPLDHLQRDAQVADEGHVEILAVGTGQDQVTGVGC